MFPLHAFQRVVQEVDRDVDRDVAAGLEQRKEPRRLGAIARAQIDQRRSHADLPGHLGTVRREDGGLGAGRVVLRQFGDRLEQMGAEPVVQVLGRDMRSRLQQTSLDRGALGGRIGRMPLDEARRAQGKVHKRHGREPYTGRAVVGHASAACLGRTGPRGIAAGR